MPTITVYKVMGRIELGKALQAFRASKPKHGWFLARPNKYSREELFIQYFFYESLEQHLKKLVPNEAHEIVSLLKQNGKTRVLKKVVCFLSKLTKTFEVYRGPDEITQRIVSFVAKVLKVELKPLTLSSTQLQRIYAEHGLELRQAMFKNVDGLMYEVLRGRQLEQNRKFKDCLSRFANCLRVISFRPNIRFLRSGSKYQITLNGDRGTIRFSSDGLFRWRPRYEIRQIIFLIAATIGMLTR